MDLNTAFKRAVQKYYEGYSYDSSKKIGLKDKEFEYDFDKLDGIHQEMKTKKKRPYVRKKDKVLNIGDDSELDLSEEDDNEDF